MKNVFLHKEILKRYGYTDWNTGGRGRPFRSAGPHVWFGSPAVLVRKARISLVTIRSCDGSNRFHFHVCYSFLDIKYHD